MTDPVTPMFDRRNPSQYPCSNQDKRITMLEHSNEAMKETLHAVSTKLDLILAQITKVAILEERHETQQIDLTRAHTKIESMDKSHSDFAREVREFINEAKGMAKIAWMIWGILGGTVMALLVKVLFFTASHGMTP